MVENNNNTKGPLWITQPDNKTNSSLLPFHQSNNGPPQICHYQEKTKSRAIISSSSSVLQQKKLYFISSSLFFFRASLMETMPLFLLLLLSLSNSLVSSDPAPVPIMTFPISESLRREQSDSTYSLFPNEDLRTGKKIRFDDEQGLLNRGGRPIMSHPSHPYYPSGDRDRGGGGGGDRYRYPIMFEDRIHRPGDYNSQRDYNNNPTGSVGSGSSRFVGRDRAIDPFRSRGSRVYFDEEMAHRDRDRDRVRFYPVDDRFPAPPPPSKNYYDRFSQHYDRRERPSLLDRPISPVVVRPYHQHSLNRNVPVPGPSHSKLPVGASFLGNGGSGGSDVRIHVFDPESNSFGNPRHSSGKDPNSNSFVPSPELFLNHDQYVEYHRKIALARDQEFKRLQAVLANQKLPTTTELPTSVDDPKRVLFTAQQPFDIISGLFPPEPDATTPQSPDGKTIVQSQSPNGENEQNKNQKSSHHHDNDHDLHSNGGQVPVLTRHSSKGRSEQVISEVNKNPSSSTLTHNNHYHQGGNNNNVQKNNNASHNNDNVELSSITTTKKNDAYGESGTNVQVESENSKITQAQVIEFPQPDKFRSGPNFISKSSRRLAYEQIQRQIQSNHRNVTIDDDEEHRDPQEVLLKGYPAVNHFTAVRQPLTSFSNFEEAPRVVVKENQVNNNDGDIKNHHEVTSGKSSTTPTTTTSTIRTMGERENQDDGTTATALIEIPKEADGFIQVVPQFDPGTKTSNKNDNKHSPLKQNPYNHHYQHYSSYKGKKSGLRAEVEVSKSRSRIKTNSGDKIAIIKQQELKHTQKQKKQKMQNNESYVKEHDKIFNRQKTRSFNLLENNNSDATANLQVPFRIPSKDFNIKRVREMKRKHLLLKKNNHNHDIDHYMDYKSNTIQRLHQSHPFLDNNDLIDPGISVAKLQQKSQSSDNGTFNNDYNDNKNQEEKETGHFTLINQNNDQVDILDDEDERLAPPKKLYQLDLYRYHKHDNNNVADDTRHNRKEDDLISKNTLASPSSSSSSASNFIKVIRLKDVNKAALPVVSAAAFTNLHNPQQLSNLSTASKTVSMFMVQKMSTDQLSLGMKKKDHATYFGTPNTSNYTIPSHRRGRPRVLLSSSINSTTLSLLKSNKNWPNDNNRVDFTVPESSTKSTFHNIQPLLPTVEKLNEPKKLNNSMSVLNNNKEVAAKITQQDKNMKMSMTSSTSHGVIKKVHAHVSHCPKHQSPAEIICDIHIRESHGHPNPQLTVGWRRKFYNSTQPDILLVSNMTQIYEKIESSTSTKFNPVVIRDNKNKEEINHNTNKDHLEDFHDKFNVTLAPGISPMLRSVLLIRSVTPPDCGNYQCQVTDGIYTLSSETLLFLCH